MSLQQQITTLIEKKISLKAIELPLKDQGLDVKNGASWMI